MTFFATVVSAIVLSGQIASGQPLDPAAWGSDHVGKPVPNFTSGDECLFCHRDMGWFSNRHGQTVSERPDNHIAIAELAHMPDTKGLVSDIQYLMGRKNSLQFLKASIDHGRLDVLSVKGIHSKGTTAGGLIKLDNPHWDTKVFGARCAGCHSTGVDSAKQTFAAISLDCFVCHGEPPEKHTTQRSLALLSPHRQESAAVVTSICAQCHLRGGISKSSGLPYPNNFIAGDNLFRDFQVDMSAASIENLNPADRHVQENVRDVVVSGREGVTCLSCHTIHRQSAKKHHTVADGAICLNCHSTESKKIRVRYEVHSKTCDY